MKKYPRTTILVAVLGLSNAVAGFADEAGTGIPDNGTSDATDPSNGGGIIETNEAESTLEAWWNELLEDLGFVTPDDEAGTGGD